MIKRCCFHSRNISKFSSIQKGMPKPKKPKSGENKEKPVKDVPKGPIRQNKEGNISINILAKPGAKSNNITDVGLETIGVQISAPPVDGEANAELVKFFASVFDLRKSDVTLDKGSKSRQKTIVLHSNTLSVADVIEKLKAAMEK